MKESVAVASPSFSRHDLEEGRCRDGQRHAKEDRANPRTHFSGEFSTNLVADPVLGDRRPAGGNVLAHAVLDALPPHPGGPDAPRVVYGEACRLGEATLRRMNVTFRQTPYALREG